MTKQPRIAPCSAEQGEQLAREWGLPAATGRLQAFRILARSPDLARGIFAQHAAMRHGGRLSDRHRELLILRVAWRSASAYEWAQHWTIAIAGGLAAEDLLQVRRWPESGRFDAADRAVLAAVDDVFDVGEVRAENWSRCTERLGDPLLAMEVTAAIMHWAGLAVLFKTLAVPLEDGASPWAPDAQAPPAVPPGARTD